VELLNLFFGISMKKKDISARSATTGVALESLHNRRQENPVLFAVLKNQLAGII
jgi:hypothetical protein